MQVMKSKEDRTSLPMLCLSGHTSKEVPYADSPSYDKPYKGEAILRDLVDVLREFHPTVVIVPHPADAHGDSDGDHDPYADAVADPHAVPDVLTHFDRDADGAPHGDAHRNRDLDADLGADAQHHGAAHAPHDDALADKNGDA